MWENSHMVDEGLIARNVGLRMAIMGLGPKALSLKAGLNETYVRDLVQGRSRNPRQAHLQHLATALDCQVTDLTGEPPDDPRLARLVAIGGR
jgi:DNA-binding Xre family transcriptional regulator